MKKKVCSNWLKFKRPKQWTSTVFVHRTNTTMNLFNIECTVCSKNQRCLGLKNKGQMQQLRIVQYQCQYSVTRFFLFPFISWNKIYLVSLLTSKKWPRVIFCFTKIGIRLLSWHTVAKIFPHAKNSAVSFTFIDTADFGENHANSTMSLTPWSYFYTVFYHNPLKALT